MLKSFIESGIYSTPCNVTESVRSICSCYTQPCVMLCCVCYNAIFTLQERTVKEEIEKLVRLIQTCEPLKHTLVYLLQPMFCHCQCQV